MRFRRGACLASSMTDEAYRSVRFKPSALHHFCERKQKRSFLCRFFHFKRPPGLRLALDAAERNRKFGHIECQRGEKRSNREKSVPLQKKSINRCEERSYC